MGKIIAVVSGKGGTGKTSFTANIGFSLAAAGKKTLCMDCDIFMRNLDLALGLSDRSMMDFTDVLTGRCGLVSAVVTHPKYKNLDLLTAPTSLNQLDIFSLQLDLFAQAIKEIYDYCIIDAPAGMGIGFQMATKLADSVIVVTTTDNSALRDAQRTVMELNQFPAGSVHLVVNRVQRKVLRTLHTTIDDAIDTAGLPLLGVVPEDKDVSLALNKGFPLRDTNYYAGWAYDNIANRILGKKIPLMRI